MRIFAISDLHVDYEPNREWVQQLSRADYVDDMLILAGDISHKQPLLEECLLALTSRFAQVLFVPGNHDLWVLDEPPGTDSITKFNRLAKTVSDCGAFMEPIRRGELLVVPLLGWYDYSFGMPGKELNSGWTDFRACRWPAGFTMDDVAAYFDRLNAPVSTEGASKLITVSHFLPRIDLIPSYVHERFRVLDPVLGSTRIEERLRRLKPSIHVYGHSHINRSVWIDGIRYVNNAFGNPRESRITSKQLLCIEEIELP
ncbi:metallophosphoesterase [Ottowia thiooxydans]|uniref:metallophosphoesterase n=1 Tax=Ottowia thiooxydans TaxID=219182 RepID=UPI00041AD5C0|nr:metallophosphoesterase [Ottowia thiooxydans]